MPRWALEVAFAPVRGLLWVYGRYQIGDRARQIFFNDAGTVGLYPTAFAETGFGLNFGGRLLHRDLFGNSERLRLRASYGGRYRQLYSIKLSSGELVSDRVAFELEADYEQFPKSRFSGLGNGDLSEVDFVDPLVDPITSTTAVATRYRHDDYRLAAVADVGLARSLALRLSGSIKNRTFNDDVEPHDGDAAIFTIYDRSRLVGYDNGLDNIYLEADLTYDSRRVRRFYQSAGFPSTGWQVSGFAGYQLGRGDDPSAHGRYGIDLQRYFDLYMGDRVLIVRVYFEGVTGHIDDVPFVDLPHLGGPLFLRGYDRDRFRDRLIGLGTVEYMYSASPNVAGYLFVDAGRAWRRAGEIELTGIRVGYGGGIQLHSKSSFRARLFLASSIDGGLFVNLGFDPVFDARSREESP